MNPNFGIFSDTLESAIAVRHGVQVISRIVVDIHAEQHFFCTISVCVIDETAGAGVGSILCIKESALIAVVWVIGD